jgi:energy-coupling factor transporter ATP-binding protein EcfA2
MGCVFAQSELFSFLLKNLKNSQSRPRQTQQVESSSKKPKTELEEEEKANLDGEPISKSNVESPSDIVAEANTQVLLQPKTMYRLHEFNRIKSSLLADSSYLVIGEEGSGKSTLCKLVEESLFKEGFKVVVCKKATPKTMLKNIATGLGMSTLNEDGKEMKYDELKGAVEENLLEHFAFLIFDNAHKLSADFRLWLKELHEEKVRMLLFATKPPRTDIFLCLPYIKLSPLPDYAIREIMEQAARDRKMQLSTSDFARIQELAGGNPLLAIKAVENEYMELDVEGGDHENYMDATPLIVVGGIVFIIMRFIGLGTNNPALYIFGGVAASIFTGLVQIVYRLPREGKNIN